MEKTTIKLQEDVTMEMIGTKRIKSVKPVMCITEGKTFSSVSDAAEYYGVHVSTISKACCKGKTCKGNKFCFVDKVKENLNVITEEIQTNRNVNTHSTLQRKIKCIETGITYRSICNASKEINIPRTTLYRHLEGRLEDLNGKHYVFVNDECSECVKEMDPIIEKANAYDILMAKKVMIVDLRKEIDVLYAKRDDAIKMINALKEDLTWINDNIRSKVDAIAETEDEIKKELGLN